MSELCEHRWPTIFPRLVVLCDRKPKHTGKHRNRDHGLEWWGGKKEKEELKP